MAGEGWLYRYIATSHTQITQTTTTELQDSPLAGEYIFDEALHGYQAAERIQVDVSLRSNSIMLDTLITLIRFIQDTSKSSSQGSKGTGHFSKQTASTEKTTEPKCQDVHTPVYTEAREHSHQTIFIIRRLVQNRRGPLGYANCAWGTESRL